MGCSFFLNPKLSADRKLGDGPMKKRGGFPALAQLLR
jgi:hypothetical protein